MPGRSILHLAIEGVKPGGWSKQRMYIVAIGWLFVVVCMTAVEATTSSIAGALVTLFFYGLLPLALFLWLVGTPQRRRNRAGAAARKSGASFTPRSRDDDR